MIAIATILLAAPLGYFFRNRVSAVVTYLAAFHFAYTFQTLYLLRSWVSGDYSAFPEDPDTLPLAYGLISAAILGAGVGLVLAGHRFGTGRRAARVEDTRSRTGQPEATS